MGRSKLGVKPAVPLRPYPPQDLTRIQPAEGVGEWVQREILEGDGRIHNPDHVHLLNADLEFLWAPQGFAKQMRSVIGQAEEVMIRAGGWQKLRQEQQMVDWFGRVPKYLITFDARYCASCSDVEFCALVEHELYHLAHKVDMFGAPAFTKEGAPKIGIQGHDVEEFTGVVRRYGVGSADGNLAQMIRAAQKAPEVAAIRISQACGTCMLRAA
jgi:hypothetical protein